MQQRALAVVADQALDPEEAGRANPARDRRHLVKAGGRVDDHVAGAELDAVLAVGVLDLQLAAVILVGVGEEERGRHVGPELAAIARVKTNAAVDMGAELHAFAVAVEHRRIEDVGQHGADEDRVALERRYDDALAGRSHLGLLVDLLVELDRRTLVARGDPAIDPVVGAVEPFAQADQLCGV